MFSEDSEGKSEPKQEQEPVNVVVELNCPMIWPSTQNDPDPKPESE